MTRDELLSKKKPGDWKLVGEMLNISDATARMRFNRPGKKRYKLVADALTKVIESRESLLNSKEDNK